MLLRLLLEGLGLGALLVLICALGIRKGAVGMVHLYHEDVQSRTIAQGLITKEQIRKNSLRFAALPDPAFFQVIIKTRAQYDNAFESIYQIVKQGFLHFSGNNRLFTSESRHRQRPFKFRDGQTVRISHKNFHENR